MTVPSTLRGWALMLALAALVGWTAWPQPSPGPVLVAPRRDAWALPVLPRRGLENSTIVIAATAPFWGAPIPVAAASAPPPPPPPPEPRWRIAAVFGHVAKRGVLITFDADVRPPQRLFVGDKLPGGYLVTNIEEREICVLVGKKSYRLGVEPIEP
jgi:hypothetical protein